MTDLEMTKLCAEAMELRPQLLAGALRLSVDRFGDWVDYDPLHDDAQAMALVKKFELQIWPDYDRGVKRGPLQGWYAWCPGVHSVHNPNLNHAIVECVANSRRSSTTQERP